MASSAPPSSASPGRRGKESQQVFAEADGVKVRSQSGEHDIDAWRRLSFQDEWTIWFDVGFPRGCKMEDYEKSIKRLGSFKSVQDFWRYWNNVDLLKLPDSSNLRLFKAGIRPTWEDPVNKEGGKWVVRPKQNSQAVQYYLDLVLATIGGQLHGGEDVNGIVFSVRGKGNTINLWNRSSKNQEQIETVAREIMEVCSLPDDMDVEYMDHRGTMNFNENVRKSRHKRKEKKKEKEKDKQRDGGEVQKTTSGDNTKASISTEANIDNDSPSHLNPNAKPFVFVESKHEEDERPAIQLDVSGFQMPLISETTGIGVRPRGSFHSFPRPSLDSIKESEPHIMREGRRSIDTSGFATDVVVARGHVVVRRRSSDKDENDRRGFLNPNSITPRGSAESPEIRAALSAAGLLLGSAALPPPAETKRDSHTFGSATLNGDVARDQSQAGEQQQPPQSFASISSVSTVSEKPSSVLSKRLPPVDNQTSSSADVANVASKTKSSSSKQASKTSGSTVTSSSKSPIKKTNGARRSSEDKFFNSKLQTQDENKGISSIDGRWLVTVAVGLLLACGLAAYFFDANR